MTEATLRPGAIPLRFLKMETFSYLSAPAAVFWTFVYPIALFFILNTIFGGGRKPVWYGVELYGLPDHGPCGHDDPVHRAVRVCSGPR